MHTVRRIVENPTSWVGNCFYRWEKCAETRSSYRPRLLTRMREELRARHYSRRTEQAYCSWIRRFIYYHNVRHPAEMGGVEINAFRLS